MFANRKIIYIENERKSKMKKYVSTLFVLALGSTAAFGLFAADEAAVKPAAKPAGAAVVPAEPAKDDVKAENPLAFLPDVVAKVGKTEITKQDILEEAKPIIMMQKGSKDPRYADPKMWEYLASQIANDLVERKVLQNIAKADGVEVTDKDVDAEFESIKKEIPPEELAKLMKEQQLTEGDIKAKIKSGIGIKKWFETKVIPSVTDADAEKFYRENQEQMKSEATVNASHILIKPESPKEEELAKMTPEEKKKVEDSAKAAAKEKANAILAKLKQGEDFAKLAKENSACPSGQKDGGNLGDFPKGNMVKEFEDAAFSLKPGELSGVVETQFGYHIIKLNSKKDAGFVPLADVKEDIKKKLSKEKVEKLVNDYKQKEKVEVFIKAPAMPMPGMGGGMGEEMDLPPQP